MKFSLAVLIVVIVGFDTHAIGQPPGPAMANEAASRSSASAAEATPAEQRIDGAKRQIAANPKGVQAFNDLAGAYIRRARETADPIYLSEAEHALMQGFALDANDFQLRKTQVALMLARGQFADAKAAAMELNRRTLDDVMVYGYLAEAEIGLGDYENADKNAQWMLNMLPNNVPGLVLGAKLRVHYGDPNGAIEFLNLAYNETSPSEVEELAWIANQIAAIEIESGHPEDAIATLKNAEDTFPHYPETEKNLSRARLKAHSAPASSPDATEGEENKPSRSISPIASSDASHTTDRHTIAADPVLPPVPLAWLTPGPSETEHLIRKQQSAAAANAKDAKVFATLGAAYFQRARETGDVSDFEMAEQALKKSLVLAPNDFSSAAALGTMADVCMGEHRFVDALVYAEKALSLGSGDLSPFAIVGDAYADMGDYDKAHEAYLKLTPAGTESSARSAYARDSRLAYLSFIRGDGSDAIRLMKTAVIEGAEAAIPSENLAWLYYELGEFSTQVSDVEAADEAYRAALNIHPGDYRALAGLAKLRANHGRDDDAVLLYKKAIAVVPMPIFVAELGDLYTKMGNRAEARKQYELVEYIGKLGSINQVLHNRDLALFYADHDMRPNESLALARKEFEVRHDVYTWDALAWSLYKNGQFAEAAKASDEALKFGTRDSLLLFHAGLIEARLGQTDRARGGLEAALRTNPQFSVLYADAARQELARLSARDGRQESAVNHAR